MKIAQKLLITIAGSLLSFLVINLLIVNIQTTELTNEIISENLLSKIHGDINATNAFLKDYYDGIELKNGTLIGKNGKTVEGDYTFVDMLQNQLSDTATIFKKEADDFTRVTTNVRQADGTRAVGTKLGKESAAYKPVMNGELYVGEAFILDKLYYTAYNPLFSNSGEVIGIMYLGVSQQEALDIVSFYRTGSATIILLSSTLFTILILFISNLIVKRAVVNPITKTVSLLKNISEGEGDLTLRLESRSKDEIGDLSRYFNLTIEKIRLSMIQIHGQSDALKESGVSLATNMAETAAAINQITANISSIQNQTVNQSASVTETSATIEQVSKGIERLNELITDQSANITQSSSAIEEMMANIHSVTMSLVKNEANISRLTESSQNGKTQVEKIANAITDVAKDSQSLLEVSSLIQGIASQTNLLAMNAAIEAAHAGEFGKGFAVVADEVRKLAETSSAQTKTITAMLKKITASIQEITAYSENVVSTFMLIEDEVETVGTHEATILNAMKEQNEGGRQILESISALNTITQNVHQNSEEMLTGSQQVLEETKNMNHITQEITNGMNEMASGSKQISVAVEQVNQLSVENTVSIENLSKEVQKFKV
jgi:methyl-accepting chemotaxis protein